MPGFKRGNKEKGTTLLWRGEKMRGFRDMAVEPVKASVNVGRGPTRGNKA